MEQNPNGIIFQVKEEGILDRIRKQGKETQAGSSADSAVGATLQAPLRICSRPPASHFMDCPWGDFSANPNFLLCKFLHVGFCCGSVVDLLWLDVPNFFQVFLSPGVSLSVGVLTILLADCNISST